MCAYIYVRHSTLCTGSRLWRMHWEPHYLLIVHGWKRKLLSRGLPGHLCKYLLRTTMLALKEGRPWDGAPWRLSVDHTAN